jgi:hypothetical protein
MSYVLCLTITFVNWLKFSFCEIYGSKKGKTTKFFCLLFIVVFGSGIRDPGFEINIPDPQHCLKQNKVRKRSYGAAA